MATLVPELIFKTNSCKCAGIVELFPYSFLETLLSYFLIRFLRFGK